MNLKDLKREAEELLQIFSSSLGTARRNIARKLLNSQTPKLMNCLLLVDLQNDFLPGGALAVPEGDTVIPVANQLQAAFPLVVATQDWHPANHGSFAANHPGKQVFEQMLFVRGSRHGFASPVVAGGTSAGKAFNRDLQGGQKVGPAVETATPSFVPIFGNPGLSSTRVCGYQFAPCPHPMPTGRTPKPA